MKTRERILRCFFLGLSAVMLSCGPQSNQLESIQINMPLPWQANAASCTTSVLATMKVEVIISGYEQEPPCQLDIGGDLRVMGTCPGIQRGLTRYLLLSYRLESSNSENTVDLAHMISYVDLSEETIGDATSQSVDLQDNGTTGLLVYKNSDVEDLPEMRSQSGDSQMNSAKAWAKNVLLRNNVNFDQDRDGCPNLNEACVNTIFDENNLSNCN